MTSDVIRGAGRALRKALIHPALAAIAAALLVLFAMYPTLANTPDHRSPAPAQWREKIESPSGPRGEWSLARDGSGVAAAEQEELDRLRTLGYMGGGASAPALSGVTVNEAERCWKGLNLYVSGDSPTARLMDMDGNVLHEWHYPFLDAWPDRQREYSSDRGATNWFHAHLFENGDLLAMYNGLGLVKLDKDSKLIWKYAEGSHHHFVVLDDGRIIVLTREDLRAPRISKAVDTLVDSITTLDANGNELGRISLLDAFWNSNYASWLRAPAINRMNRRIDLFHTNRIVVLDGSLADRIPSFREGNLLISSRSLNALVVVDTQQRAVVWSASGPWLQQHCPSVLDNGNILLFDNQGNYGASRVLEYDPATREIEWRYDGGREEELYSERFGTAQRLPNGNTLIAESHYGRALEVTPEGDVVWEFYTPERAGDDDELIANLFEIERIPPDFPTNWME